MKRWKVVLVCGTAAILIATGQAHAPREELCNACGVSRLAPCLIDLQKGSVEELRIYENTGEEQQGRMLISFHHGSICIASSGPDGGTLETTIDVTGTRNNAEMRRMFCSRCRAALTSLSDADHNARWILADLSEERAPQYYLLKAGELQIRDYELTMSPGTEENEIELSIEVPKQ